MTDHLTHLSLFSGIGGFEIASGWAGFETIRQVEINEYCQKILQKNFGDVPRSRDIKNVKGMELVEEVGQPALITAGCPCQPHSIAGCRKGSCDDRDLWPETARCIDEIRPEWFLAENVSGILSTENGQFFGGILRDLASMGYDVAWGSWEAAYVGAPHFRERVFTLAHANCNRCHGTHIPVRQRRQDETTPDSTRGNQGSSYTDLQRLQGHGEYGERTGERTLREGAWETPWYDVAARVCRVDAGAANRVDRITALGNAVVPQQVYPLLQAIAEVAIQ